jgi:hypothetical protein
MLLVIFGAGATYDSAAYFPATAGNTLPRDERPPLADDLFDNRVTFQGARRHFPQLGPMLPELINRGPGTTVEQVLRRNLDRAAEYPPQHEQLAAVRYYLQSIMKNSIDGWYESRARQASNHGALIHQIRQARYKSRNRDPVCLVTFNYDLLIELALGKTFASTDDYINDADFKLFKVHGSVNWARKVLSEVVPPAMATDPLGQARLMISKAASLKLSSDIEIAQGTPPETVSDHPFYPAIAIPVEQKSDFECPASHLKLLRELLPKVDKVLIIGWRATEAHFLNVLRECMRPSAADIVACCGSEHSAHATLTALGPVGIGKNFMSLKAGFSEMVANRQLDDFLAGC